MKLRVEFDDPCVFIFEEVDEREYFTLTWPDTYFPGHPYVARILDHGFTDRGLPKNWIVV